MICFVIAMESEAQPLINNLEDVQVQCAHGRAVVRGKLDGSELCAVICGVGKVNAAAGAQYAIDALGADAIINIGVAGGLNGSVKVGEIYSVSAAVQYDFDLTQLNGTEIGTLDEYDENYLPCSPLPLFPARKLGTGDRFNDDKNDYMLLTSALGADIRDMEGGAIAQVCKRANLPFYSVKAISDIAGSGSTTEQFKANLKLCTDRLERALPAIYEAING